MLEYGPGAGFIGDSFLELWPPDRILEYNRDLEVRDYLSDVTLFATNGANEAFGFQPSGGRVVFVNTPLIGMGPECLKMVADGFIDFLRYIEQL